uniref:Uncharacterized protein n=1 Tax=Anguilla anguilla TaxID=7936 RepID=A0A0E9TJN0_ANGAN
MALVPVAEGTRPHILHWNNIPHKTIKIMIKTLLKDHWCPIKKYHFSLTACF